MGQTEQEVATIAVMGATGSGKTTFINMVSGSQLRTSQSLKSCTEVVAATDPFVVDGRKVVLVDTPGFDDTTKTDSEILKLIADFLATSYQNGTKLMGLLFIHRISDFRMGGISLKNFKTFRKLCGESTLRNVIIVTNMWGEVTPQLGAQREHELSSSEDFFKPALDKGAKMLRHHNTLESGHEIVRHILRNNPMALQIQKEIVEEKKDVSQTAAADEIERELRAEKERQRIEAERVKRELEEATRKREEELRKQREEDARRRQAELDRIAAEQRRVQEQMERERREMERRMREEEENRRREMERIHRENQERIERERREAEEAHRRWREEQDRLQRELEWQRIRRAREDSGGPGIFPSNSNMVLQPLLLRLPPSAAQPIPCTLLDPTTAPVPAFTPCRVHLSTQSDSDDDLDFDFGIVYRMESCVKLV
ncbi:hypothetical protein NMY22_g16206 [Coprinellus aureogranulatus]|nr:hypothetical protein NMY22_g16206 [Coprinellus aureogranulatus]